MHSRKIFATINSISSLDSSIIKRESERTEYSALQERLNSRGASWCTLIEKYNTIPKATRIEMAKGTATKRIIYPQKGLFGLNTDMGQFMEQFISYSAVSKNVHDDAADDIALFVLEIIEERSKPQVAEPLKGVREYF